ncbi:glutaredoxin family protein [Microaceticoccus formicicus]|uniref:glutaredoxin family protein n=1 Tax=Microaceticoccus formicicus TaxID=3118105 RepID=UPI003CCFFB94|nr:glutaredoxin [Peptoniphilaceae bacterium AMB_02]
MPKLELYIKPTCPYCMKVVRFLEKNNLDIPLLNIDEDNKYRETLESVGGKVQVPCLFVDGKPMYESSDIISYLKDTLVKGQ